MNLKIGAIIKQLRQKSNVTQEQLANAIYVSPQAISRWESETCYPDIEFLPALADFFAVSVDELIGYKLSEKEQKLKEIKEEIERLNEIGTLDEQLEYARYAVSLYPSDDELRLNLANQIGNTVWDENPDIDRMKEAEAIHLSLLNENTTDTVRYRNLWSLTLLYTKGFKNPEKALEIVDKLPKFIYCREYRLAYGVGDGKSEYYAQDFIDLLAGALCQQISNLVLCDDASNEPSTWDKKIKMYETAYKIMELVYEGDYMYHNNYLAFNRWLLSTYLMAQGKIEQTFVALEKMCEHAIADVESAEKDRGRTFKSILLDKVEYPYPNPNFHENKVHNVCFYMLDRLEAERYNPIRKDERFVKIVKALKEYAK